MILYSPNAVSYRIPIEPHMQIKLPSLPTSEGQNDWYLKGKIKFLAKRVFTPKDSYNENRVYSLSIIESEGLCDKDKCKKCLPFKFYIKLLKKYIRKQDMKERSKIMQLLSKLESHMLVPNKYHIHKSETAETSYSSDKNIPCESSNKKSKVSAFRPTKSSKGRDKTASIDTTDTKKSRLSTSHVERPARNKSSMSNKQKKTLVKALKNKKKNKGFLYASCNIRI